jgi:hypothetical protein
MTSLNFMSKKYLYIIYIIFWATNSLFAQHMPYINYTTHNGLPQIQVQFLHQDSKGYIWVGTKGGLARYNGENFEIFLKNQYIFRIDESTQGDIMIGTRKGIYKFEKGKMILLHHFTEATSFLAGNGKYWLYDAHSIKEIQNGKILRKYQANLIFSHFAYSNYFDSKSNIAYFRIKDSLNILKYIQDGKFIKQTFKGVISLEKFENGNVYVIEQENQHITVQNPLTRHIYFTADLENGILKNFNINDLPVDLHLFRYGFQYYLLNRKNHSSEHLSFPILKMPFDAIMDFDGNYWVATDNGLYQVGNGALKMFPKEYMNDVWTLIKGKNGKYYSGEYTVGLFEMQPETYSKVKLPTLQSNGKPETEFYYGASTDSSGNLYFPTQNGILKYDYHHFKHIDHELSIITQYDPYSKSTIVGQENGLAFFDVNGQKKTFKDESKKLIISRPTCFEFKNEREIWIGSWENMVVFNRASGTFSDINRLFNNAPSDGVISMDKDAKGNIWLGGTDGLWYYNLKTNQFTKLSSETFQTYILDIEVIQDKHVLVGTSHELYIIDLLQFNQNGQLNYKMYNYRNGFVSEEIAQNGFLVDGNKVFIPSTTFTSVLDLNKISYTPDYFNVWVSRINDTGLSNSEENGKSTFRLPKSVNKLEIKYETVGFGLPTQSVFQYKLEGFDENWSDWTHQKQVIYTNLKSGKYTFKVRAKNGSQTNSSSYIKESLVQIKVSLPLFQEPFFYKLAFFLSLLFSGTTAYLVYIYYKNRIKVAENERKLKFHEIATLQAQMNPHFIFNFLSSVQSIINKQQPEKANEFLVKFSRLLRSYMESSIKSTQILSGNITNNEISIKDEVEMLKMYMDLEKMKYPEGKINYVFDIENQNILNKTIPPLIIQPFMENAIKHGILPGTDQGLIKINMIEQDDAIICQIQDNGIGRKESLQRKQQSIPANKSRGLELIKNRVEVLNQLGYHIEITIIDPDEGGTIIQIRIG